MRRGIAVRGASRSQRRACVNCGSDSGRPPPSNGVAASKRETAGRPPPRAREGSTPADKDQARDPPLRRAGAWSFVLNRRLSINYAQQNQVARSEPCDKGGNMPSTSGSLIFIASKNCLTSFLPGDTTKSSPVSFSEPKLLS